MDLRQNSTHILYSYKNVHQSQNQTVKTEQFYLNPKLWEITWLCVIPEEKMPLRLRHKKKIKILERMIKEQFSRGGECEWYVLIRTICVIFK